MTRIEPTRFLRLALVGDALASGGTGLLTAFAAGPLSGHLGLPEPLLRGCGVFLIAYAAFVALLGTRDQVARPLVWLVIVGNALWAIDSAVLLMSGSVSPTSLGTAFVIFQAVVVAAFAELQFIGLRRSMPAAFSPASA